MAGPQGKRGARRTRTREDREKRNAAFTQKRRGRPKGARRAFFDDDDRFAIAMIACGEHLLGIPRYHAAYIALALTSDGPIDARSIDDAMQLSGGPRYATLPGASYTLIAKCDTPKTVAEADWIASSAALLYGLIKLHVASRDAADPTRLRMTFDGLAVRGWGPTLLKLAEKLAAIGASNLPPIEAPVPSHVRARLNGFTSKSKS
ncbi:hypothetical protein CWO91_36875 [Bradyrhizobium genosp. SA-3]|nr:hypothetical protein CWO91_36875 [Bradyrhizobium genosp. SA-3]